MSYYTRTEFTFSDYAPATEAILARARPYLESHERGYIVEHVLEGLAECIDEEEGDLKGIVSDDIDGLMAHVSAGFPGVTFFVRGMGEEFADLWLRVFRDGKVVFRMGPFDDQLEPAMRGI
jgi:hypothetical protein